MPTAEPSARDDNYSGYSDSGVHKMVRECDVRVYLIEPLTPPDFLEL